MPDDEPATGSLPDVSVWLGRSGRVVTSPARRCRVPGAPVEQRLRPWDLGNWRGRPLADCDLTAWQADPTYDRHGGESLMALRDRVSSLLEAWHGLEVPVAAVTHAAVIKVAVVLAMQAPIAASWRLDVHPGSTTELHPAGAGWRIVHVNHRPSGGRGGRRATLDV